DLQRARLLVPDAIFISAHTREGVPALEERCLELMAGTQGSAELLVPPHRYDVIAKLHALGHIQEQDHRDDGIYVRARIPLTQTGFFEPFMIKGEAVTQSVS
ncbi:MAG: GTPase HflX, partial [Cephaloticoccus sp.]|nr:GTPase HflX [Cephaloticoccus sp.]